MLTPSLSPQTFLSVWFYLSSFPILFFFLFYYGSHFLIFFLCSFKFFNGATTFLQSSLIFSLVPFFVFNLSLRISYLFFRAPYGMLLVCVLSHIHNLFRSFLPLRLKTFSFFFSFFSEKFKTSTFHNTTRVLKTHHFNKSFFFSHSQLPFTFFTCSTGCYQ